jgi:hypothetical protein
VLLRDVNLACQLFLVMNLGRQQQLPKRHAYRGAFDDAPHAVAAAPTF